MRERKSGETTWFTSDTHFYHTNIIKYCDRPFSDVNEMNEKIIRNWNERVMPNDLVFHLGDFGLFKRDKRPESVLNRLNGRIYLIRGNHDHTDTRRTFEKDAEGAWLSFDSWVRYNDTMCPALMVHKPQNAPTDMFFGREMEDGTPQIILYGHVHEKAPKGIHLLEFPDGSLRPAYHVGVDTNDFCPVEEKTIGDSIAAAGQDYSGLEVFKVGLPESFG